MWMQERSSLNFEPLRSHHAELASMGGFAEHYAFSDPESALVKLRISADLLASASFTMLADRLVLDKFQLHRKLSSSFLAKSRTSHGHHLLLERLCG
ncbi:hypothetical protein [Thauera terpenica]|uniref:hypothetical protein n=1 Tax=Thauera terpenica TaxID=76113 RepID=UPI001574F1C0|nr:hypothetical protein [Thauera terpenica]